VAIRSAVYVSLSESFGDARWLVQLCEQAEASGWDGFFTWDVLYSGVEPILDPWVVLSACAARTNAITLGALVTPVARRRPVKLARELLSLDQLSQGRVVAGVGLGDSSELRMIGEQVSPSAFAQRFEAGTVQLDRLLHQTDATSPTSLLDGPLGLGPRPTNGRIPLWLGMVHDRPHGPRRAATLPVDGIVPMRRPWDLHHLLGADELRTLVQTVVDAGGHVDDVANIGRRTNPGCQPLEAYAEAGATWWLELFHPDVDSLSEVVERVRSGPSRW
jgi:Luciferase-like monooxygenase